MANSTILITNKEENFYDMIGPFLSRRNIVKELGHPVYDDDDRLWAFYLQDKSVIAFFAYSINKKMTGSLYVIPKYRKKGIGGKISRTLHKYIEKNITPALIKATVREEAIKIYTSLGYKMVGKIGNYTKMIKRYESSSK